MEEIQLFRGFMTKKALFIALFFFCLVFGKKAECYDLYLTNAYDFNLFVIDTDTSAVISTIPLSFSPFNIAITPDGAKSYIGDLGTSFINVFETSPFSFLTQVDVQNLGFFTPQRMGITPDGSMNLVAVFPDYVAVIDVGSDTVIATITVASSMDLKVLAISPSGDTSLVTNYESLNVNVIDVNTLSVIATISTSSTPTGVAIHPNGDYAFIGTDGGNTVRVIDMQSYTIIASITVGGSTSIIDVSPNGNYLSAPLLALNNAAIIDANSFVQLATITVGAFPVDTIFTPDSALLYFANTALLGGTPSVSIIDTASFTVISTITTSPAGIPWAFAFKPEQGPSPSPSIFLSGSASSNTFLTQTELFNEITWCSEDLSQFAEYRIYRDVAHKDQIGTVLAGAPLKFKDHNRRPNTTYSYFIVGFNQSGVSIAEASISITTGD